MRSRSVQRKRYLSDGSAKSGLVFITLPSFTNTRYCSDSKKERTVMSELDDVEWRRELVLSPDNLRG
jgi:hypothetical protein